MTAYTFSQLIDFTRTTSATYVNASGLVTTTPASVNLLLYTQDFDIATWNKAGGSVTVTANSTTAPDGTSTADTVTESVGGTTHNIYQTATVVSGSAYTWSGYVKANGRSIVQFVCQATTTIYTVEFDLTAVTTTNRSGSGSATITSVGNGWYRISATATSTGAGTGYWQMNLCSAANTPSYSGNGTSGIFLWGAQLELGSAASTYTKNVGGFFPPRFDYDPVTLQPRGFLVEEQRTNLAIYSEQFDNAAWLKNNATVTANSAVSPDGASTADLMVSAASTAITGANSSTVTFTAGAHTQSVYVKAATNIRYIQLLWTSGAVSSNYANFDLQTGTVTAGTYTSASMTNAGNGWYRIAMTSTVGAASGGMWPIAVPSASSLRAATYVGNGTDSFLIWGAQLEAGAFATSYIPTVASTVTRAADTAVIAAPMFAPWYNQTEGSFLVEVVTFKPTTVSASVIAIDVSDGGINNRDYLGFVSTAAEARTVVGGAVQAVINQNYTANAVEKLAYAVAANDFAFVRNGSLAGTDPSGTIPTVNRMFIGNAAGSAAFLNGHIRSINYYPLRLTNAQLQGLTT